MLNAADMMELADMMFRYCHLSEGFLHPPRLLFGKSRFVLVL